jgi:hypothetical protein
MCSSFSIAMNGWATVSAMSNAIMVLFIVACDDRDYTQLVRRVSRRENAPIVNADRERTMILICLYGHTRLRQCHKPQGAIRDIGRGPTCRFGSLRVWGIHIIYGGGGKDGGGARGGGGGLETASHPPGRSEKGVSSRLAKQHVLALVCWRCVDGGDEQTRRGH